MKIYIGICLILSLWRQLVGIIVDDKHCTRRLGLLSYVVASAIILGVDILALIFLCLI